MRIVRNFTELQTLCATLRASGVPVALVPTMGALHAGHIALVHAAIASRAAAIVSIFVNPLQFAPNEDPSRYPRDETGDLAVLEAAGCPMVWLPDAATMYPPGDATTVTVSGPAEHWEGKARPGHFRGVATVCAKLFEQVRPDRAYFGEKDWQQLKVVTRMARDLGLGPEIVGVPTVREADGLAMSSRNVFLTSGEREDAPLLYRILTETARSVENGTAVDKALRTARTTLTHAGFDVDYLALVDGPSLTPLTAIAPEARLIAAARLGAVRLLDNLAVAGGG